MTWDQTKFKSIEMKDGGFVTFGDNTRGKIIGIGTIGDEKVNISNVLLVDGLKHNLLSISQLCDKGYFVKFEASHCSILDPSTNEVAFMGFRSKNVYTVDLGKLSHEGEKCFSVQTNESWLWHRRLAHANMDSLSKLSKRKLVKGLPKIDYAKGEVCNACAQAKQVKSSFKPKNVVSTTRPLELIHMDLFGPIDVSSLGGSNYVFVIVDDYSRFTWTLFLRHKYDTFKSFKDFVYRVQNEKNCIISKIRSDHGGEFENHNFEEFCNELGIEHQFATPRTPQQNGVVERKNRSLQEMARSMLVEGVLPKYF